MHACGCWGETQTTNWRRYVEMLEQQQQWLVNGLQELYRRTRDGEGWPGEPLKTEANGHPLTHDLLTRLGALDQSKGERFEEDTEALQRDLWRQSQMQAQETSDDSSDVAYSPTAPNSAHFGGGLNRPHMPPTPPSHSPSTCPQNFTNIKTEPSTMSPFSNSVPATPTSSHPGHNDAFRTSMPPSSHINPMALQESGPWSVNGFSNGVEDMLGPEYSLNFDDPASATGQAIFNRGVPPVNCLPPNMLFDPNDEFTQLFHQNPEIPSI